jgi:unsaturated rhamnogalacturonyl hydrolase
MKHRLRTGGDSMSQSWSTRMADSTMARFPLLADEWNYQWGLVLKGFERVWRATGDERYFDFIRTNIDAFVQPDGAIRGYHVEEYNVDRLNTGKALFALYEQTGDTRYKHALDLLRSQLDRQPRTRSGGFWHKQIYPNQMWLDGIYMADAFWAQYEHAFPSISEASAWDDIAHQVMLIEQHTRDPKTGLLYHAWDESRQQRWANPETGCSPHFWGRAMGWYGMALVDILDCLPPDHPRQADLIAILQRMMAAAARVQGQRSRVWYQVLDQGTRAGNYLESSASCMFVYAMVKGVRREALPGEYLDIARRAYEGIIKQFVAVDDAGQVHLTGTCRSAGLGGTPYRDGSYEYYVGEPVVTDNHHGVGAFILASAEVEALDA